jgi:hypothetical protein
MIVLIDHNSPKGLYIYGPHDQTRLGLELYNYSHNLILLIYPLKSSHEQRHANFGMSWTAATRSLYYKEGVVLTFFVTIKNNVPTNLTTNFIYHIHHIGSTYRALHLPR